VCYWRYSPTGAFISILEITVCKTRSDHYKECTYFPYLISLSLFVTHVQIYCFKANDTVDITA
jgi:hypothetical protein